ncbi:MAG: hypothetical protein AAF934_00275 [Bacteroidota bacterium]
MSEVKVLELFFYLLPAVVTGSVAYYFFSRHIKNEADKRQFLLKREAQKEVLSLRLQAYERMALFLERINLSKLIIRVAPDSPDKSDYETLLIQHIETEFEHNLVQQLYISDACWAVIKTAKNAAIQLIRKTSMSDKIAHADNLRTAILNNVLDRPDPSDVALRYIKKEIRELF